MAISLNIPQKLKNKIIESENGCIIWIGAKKDGYGIVRWGTKTKRVHRLIYELLKGNLKDGLVLDHLCKNHSCVNPDHVEQVTQKINISRGLTGNWQRAKTHCPKGHEYTNDNTYYSPKRLGRECLKCKRIRGLKKGIKCKTA